VNVDQVNNSPTVPTGERHRDGWRRLGKKLTVSLEPFTLQGFFFWDKAPLCPDGIVSPSEHLPAALSSLSLCK